jgi:anaerobic selenocysteine-containing dehydrogenase
MSNTALYSDYVLPAAGWYEKDDINFGTPLSPFSHATTRAVEPLAESKSDWEFHCLFLKTLQERAIARGRTRFRDRSGKERRSSSTRSWRRPPISVRSAGRSSSARASRASAGWAPAT